MVRKYPLECFLVVIAVFGTLGLLVWLNHTLIEHWWSVNWWWIVSLILLLTGKVWWPVVHEIGTTPWQAFTTVVDYIHDWIDRNESRLLLASVRTRISEGDGTEYANAITGISFKVNDPYARGTTVKEQAAEQKEIEAPRFPQPRDFAEILSSFTPNERGIYLLDTVQGDITAPINGVCHVALGGPTGGGKTVTTRMLTSQILACEGTVYIANPNFAPVKLNGKRLEDWRPIASRLKEPPAREIGEIKDLFDRFISLFEQRRTQEQTSPRRGKDVFLVLGEWPAIVSMATYSLGKQEATKLVGQLGRLLRESRQYGIHVISEFQDALISTIGGNSGMRENYRTAYYFGGDLNTAKALLDLPNGVKLNDTGLGEMGAAYLRSHSNAYCPGRVPFFSNRALYMLLGTPSDPVSDDFVTSMDLVPDTFLPFVDADTPNIRDLRRDESGFERQSFAPNDGLLLSSLSDSSSYAQENDANRLVERAQEAQEGELKCVLDTVQIELFTVAYKITGNIDKSLDYTGVHTGYRQHARLIIAERNLKGGK